MAFKFKVDDINTVPEAYRGEYTKTTVEGKEAWLLNVEDLPQPEDVSGLKSTVEALRKEKRDALDEAKRRGEDITALTRSFDTKIKELNDKYETATKAGETATKASALTDAKTSLLGKLADGNAANQTILAPHIEKRLRIDIEDGKPITRVLDKEGKLSSSSLTDLENEFRSDKTFAAVITTSRASGSGAGGERNTAGGAGGGSGTNPDNINNLTPRQLADLAKTRRQGRGLER